jgi:hypothetical protein
MLNNAEICVKEREKTYNVVDFGCMDYHGKGREIEKERCLVDEDTVYKI